MSPTGLSLKLAMYVARAPEQMLHGNITQSLEKHVYFAQAWQTRLELGREDALPAERLEGEPKTADASEELNKAESSWKSLQLIGTCRRRAERDACAQAHARQPTRNALLQQPIQQFRQTAIRDVAVSHLVII
mmetsp:Transcript_394/g.886  ORF Transcript_394/g.886 Transcript_394/m.886 type:complete len:133 (+) Transcript_394:449-847(+)